jgi:hypothetical protein
LKPLYLKSELGTTSDTTYKGIMPWLIPKEKSYRIAPSTKLGGGGELCRPLDLRFGHLLSLYNLTGRVLAGAAGCNCCFEKHEPETFRTQQN